LSRLVSKLPIMELKGLLSCSLKEIGGPYPKPANPLYIYL